MDPTSLSTFQPPPGYTSKGFPFAEWVKNNIFPCNNSNAPASESSVRVSDTKWSSSLLCFVINGGPCTNCAQSTENKYLWVGHMIQNFSVCILSTQNR